MNFEKELIAARRAIALGKLWAFDQECWRLAALVKQGTVPLTAAIDALAEAAEANDLDEIHGHDLLQAILRDAFAASVDGTERKPPVAEAMV